MRRAWFLILVLVVAMAAPQVAALSTSRGATEHEALASITPTFTPTPIFYGCVTLQQGSMGYRSMQDTSIDLWLGDQNRGTGSLVVRAVDTTHILVGFDISHLVFPRGAVLLTAKLTLHATSRTNTGTADVVAYMVKRPWKQMEATWARPLRGELWGAAGCAQWGVDLDPIPLDKVTLNAVNTDFTWDISGAARTWYADPTSNNGVILKAVSGASVGYNLASSEYSLDSTFRPKLEVCYYIPPSPTPTFTPSRTPTPTMTATTTNTPTSTATPTASNTPTPTATNTLTQTPTETATGVPSITPSLTNTLTPSATPRLIRLPLVFRQVSLPAAPQLNPIVNSGSASYLVSWSSVVSAQTYELQEDDNAAFSSPTIRYARSDTSFTVTGQPQGTWYYRVHACNRYGCSIWSNAQSVVVR